MLTYMFTQREANRSNTTHKTYFFQLKSLIKQFLIHIPTMFQSGIIFYDHAPFIYLNIK